MTGTTLPLSVSIMPGAAVGDVVELAVLAEQLDLARVWVFDEGLVTRDVYVILTAMAAATDRIPMGPGITSPFVRHPGATASAIASLDEFSGGRAFLGLGAGGGMTLGPMAIERTRPLTAVSDMVQTLRSLFAGERVTHDGSAFSFVDAHLGYARADLDIILAGRGPRMTALGGEIADGFNLGYIHKELLGEHARALRAAAGDRPFRVSYSTALITNDEEFEAARAQLSFRLVDSPPEVRELTGISDDAVALIRQGLVEGGPRRAAQFVEPEWVSSFALIGTMAECAAELHALMAANQIDEFQLPTLDVQQAAELIERVAALFRAHVDENAPMTRQDND